MKVTLRISMYAPGLFLWIGGKNLPIFTGDFDFACEGYEFRRNVSFTEPQWVDVQEFTVRVHQKDSSAGIWIATAELGNVSAAYFEDLTKRGWIFDPEAAGRYGFPNDKKNEELQADNDRQRKQHESYVRQIRVEQSAIDETAAMLKSTAEKAQEYLYGTSSKKAVLT